MESEIRKQYQALAAKYQEHCDRTKKHALIFAALRLISFLSLVPAFVYLYRINAAAAFFAGFALLALFLFLVKRSVFIGKKLAYLEHLVRINNNEIKALNRDFSPFDSGNEFIDTHHPYSYDLDLFGRNSIFQWINRTSTQRGKIRLAEYLNQTETSVEIIRNRQTAIEELAGELNWRQDFLAKGKESEQADNPIDGTIGHPIQLYSVSFIRGALYILPPVTILLLFLTIVGTTDKHFYLLPIFAQWIIFLLYSKTISRFQKQFESQSKVLEKYAGVMHLIEKKEFKSNYLLELKSKLRNGNKSASQVTSELHLILNEFDFRQNILIGIVLNSIFLWDVRCISKLHLWQQKYAERLPEWFSVITELDALISFANLNFNHPLWVKPKLIESGFALKAVEMGHPLIEDRKCIKNSFGLNDAEQIAIITGANMAGKSTFLRTVGVNLILASCGSKVCAQEFEYNPIHVYTNMRTSDNLMNDESYFYAELLRLQTMLSRIRNGEKLFVILDEILKGTNSVDKLNGSQELIKQLLALDVHGIVATHDLKLTDLVHKYPEVIKNLCFEVQLKDNDLHFNYKLGNGVTQTMNATFLMKKMGIIPKD